MKGKSLAPRLPLRLSLTLWHLLITGGASLLIGGFVYVELSHSLIGEIDLSLRAAIAQAAGGIEQESGHMRFRDRDDLKVEVGGGTTSSFALRLMDAKGHFDEGIGSYAGGPQWPPLAGGLLTTIGRTEDGAATSWRVLTEPLRKRDGALIGWMQAAEPLGTAADTLRHLEEILLLAIPILLLVTGTGGVFLVNRTLRPVTRMSVTVRGIGATDLSRRLGYNGAHDEIWELAETFDQMLTRLQQSFEQERRFTADASHELRTPLTVLRGQIDVSLSRPRRTEEYREALQSIGDQTDRLIRLANDLLYLTRLDTDRSRMSRTRVNLGDLVAATVEQFGSLAERGGQRLSARVEEGIVVEGDFDRLVRLLMNLLDNAVKYTPRDGDIIVKACSERVSGPPIALVEVSNSGAGIPEAELPRIFERFYRVGEDRSRASGGSGLGLSIAREIAESHGGTLSASSTPVGRLPHERLTTLTLRLPCAC